ncbi:hypothetical protein D3C87_1872470 [compost metagenome]
MLAQEHAEHGGLGGVLVAPLGQVQARVVPPNGEEQTQVAPVAPEVPDHLVRGGQVDPVDASPRANVLELGDDRGEGEAVLDLHLSIIARKFRRQAAITREDDGEVKNRLVIKGA